MNSDLKEEWVEALRSGSYTQGRNALRSYNDVEDRSADEYCCLGVLADLLVKRGDAEWQGDTELYYYDEGKKLRVGESDLSRLTGYIGLPMGTQTELMTLNDDENADFDKIAGWIASSEAI
jgi:hypothetical protein